MRKGKEVVERALRLLGYTNIFGEVDSGQDAELLKRASAALNQVFADLYKAENKTYYSYMLSLNDDIPLSPQAIDDIMPYGVAMFLAQSEGNGDQQSFFAEIYTEKRLSASKPKYRIKDRLPKGGY